jgi:hypothetical protein
VRDELALDDRGADASGNVVADDCREARCALSGQREEQPTGNGRATRHRHRVSARRNERVDLTQVAHVRPRDHQVEVDFGRARPDGTSPAALGRGQHRKEGSSRLKIDDRRSCIDSTPRHPRVVKRDLTSAEVRDPVRETRVVKLYATRDVARDLVGPSRPCEPPGCELQLTLCARLRNRTVDFAVGRHTIGAHCDSRCREIAL